VNQSKRSPFAAARRNSACAVCLPLGHGSTRIAGGRHVVTCHHAAADCGGRVSPGPFHEIMGTRKSPLDLRQVLRALDRITPARRTTFTHKGGRVMQGTRPRTRTHTTPLLQRCPRVAPVGYAYFRGLFSSNLLSGPTAPIGRSFMPPRRSSRGYASPLMEDATT
jgi:hypothetical protein